MLSRQRIIENTDKFSINNYDRLPLVAGKARGVRIQDVNGDEYWDMLGVYAAASEGHNHPRIVSAICEHLRGNGISSLSGGYYSVPYGEFVEVFTRFCRMDRVIFKTGGSEAVEAAIKLAKRYAYRTKGIKKGRAEIIACENNFHGRLPNAIGLSTIEKYKKDFGPFPPGLSYVPLSDPDALGRMITPNTAAFLFEVVQGEGGVNFWEDGCLREIEKICRKNKVLMIDDEIQAGLGRTGYDFAYEHEGVQPDMIIVAKALAAAMMPMSAVAANNHIMDLINPGDEGSTFGSHPLSCVVALEAFRIYQEEKLAERSREMGGYLLSKLNGLKSPFIKEVRGRGLLVGIELVPGTKGAKYFRKKLFDQGIICETAGDNTVVRFSPPLVISREDIDGAMPKIEKVFRRLG